MAINKAVKVANQTSYVNVPRHLQNVHCDGVADDEVKTKIFESKWQRR